MWNRFWLLISVLWLGFWCWMAFYLAWHPAMEPPSFVPDPPYWSRDAKLFLAVGFAGFALWLFGRFVRYGFTLGFRFFHTSSRRNLLR